MLIAPLSQLALYLLMWFSSIQVPLLVCWASHQYLQRLKCTVSEDAEWSQNKSNKSLQSSALREAQAEVSGREARAWQLCFPGTWVAPKEGKAGALEPAPCSPPAPPPAARAPSDPASAGAPPSYVLLARSSPDQQLALRNSVCLWIWVCERNRQRNYGLGYATRSNPCVVKNLTILRYSIMRIFREVIFDF